MSVTTGNKIETEDCIEPKEYKRLEEVRHETTTQVVSECSKLAQEKYIDMTM